MKFIVSTIEEIDGKPLFKEVYRITVKCKNIHGQEFTKEVWCIDINSLEEFYVLVKEYGNLALFCEDFFIVKKFSNQFIRRSMWCIT